MKYLPILFILFTTTTAQAQYLTLPDGTTRYIPPGYEVVVVKKGPGGLVRVEGADAKKVEDLPTLPESDSQSCTPEGELSSGAPPCK
jgi:hypothetical protein